MFNPSPADVRKFFCSVLARSATSQPMDALETLAGQWLQEHPEYHPDLADSEAAVARDYPGGDGKTNPFLHLSMHLSISEQAGIDQPRGIRQALALLAARLGSAHEAQHAAMECLGEMMWTAQHSGLPPDGDRYIECVRRRATR